MPTVRQHPPRSAVASPPRLERAIKRFLSVSAVFLLGQAAAIAATCAPPSNSHVTGAELLLKANDSKSAYGTLWRGWRNVPSEAMDNYPDGQNPDAGASYRKAASMYEQGRGVAANEFMARHMNWMGSQYQDADAMYRTSLDFFARGYRGDGWIWAERAKDCGHPDAVVLLIERSIQEGKTQDALNYLELGIDVGIPQAKFLLAEQYDKGALGLPKDHQRAFNWYYLAAKDGVTKAMLAVAYYFVRGLNGVQDDVAAIHWYHKAMMAGDPDATTAYAWMLEMGRGGSVDKEGAIYYYRKAVRLGSDNAKSLHANIASQNRFIR